MENTSLKELLRKAYKAGRRNALNLSEDNFKDFCLKNKTEQLELTAVVQPEAEKFKCLARNNNKHSAWNFECDNQCKECAKL